MAAERNGHDNPEQEKGKDAGKHVRFATVYGEVFAQRAVTRGGYEQTGEKADGGYHFLDETGPPAAEGCP